MATTAIGENIAAEIQGDKLTLAVDLTVKGRPSSTGKTLLVACSGGYKEVAPGLVLNLLLQRKH